ncbi:FecR family protein [Rhizobium sp. RU36D]|uniref:FecR family protein n=1 Tax=Rhizobium sp. RU36D TaxID=1907415 RepID=UPI0015C41C90|nr:FecR family protein [Rhizobium sp. RU36D]
MARDRETQEWMLEEAMDWLIRLRAPGSTPLDEQEFQAWLNGSPARREAWQKACRTWHVIGETAGLSDDAWTENAGTVQPVHTRRRPWKAVAATAMAACLVLAVAGPSLLLRFSADYRTETAELRTIELADGSSVDLGPLSAIKTDFSGGQRRITLLSGEAYFDVEPDPARPFVVSAEGVDVTVLGTAFDIRLSDETTRVDLVHGSVALSVAGGGAYTMSPGDSVSVTRENGQVARTRIAPEDMAGWRGRRLFVENVTIASVVDEIRRYHPAWISLASSDLAGRRVTGIYDLSNPDRALEALVQPFGGKVHHVSSYMRVLALF